MKISIAPLPSDDPLMKQALDALRTYHEAVDAGAPADLIQQYKHEAEELSKPFLTTTSARWVAPTARCTNLRSTHPLCLLCTLLEEPYAPGVMLKSVSRTSTAPQIRDS